MVHIRIFVSLNCRFYVCSSTKMEGQIRLPRSAAPRLPFIVSPWLLLVALQYAVAFAGAEGVALGFGEVAAHHVLDQCFEGNLG